MGKNSNRLPGFISSSSKSDGQNVSRLMAATNLVTGSRAGANSSRLLAPGAQSDLKSSSLATKQLLPGIKFGNAPSSALTSNAATGQWTHLLRHAASGNGLANAFSGGLPGLGGIESIISGIMGLFGSGKKSLPALTTFHLPNSQQHTASVGNAASYSGGTGQTTSTNVGGVYANPGPAQSASSNLDSQWFMDNSNNIAQAVKNAMLNSNSLNDVVSEV